MSDYSDTPATDEDLQLEKKREIDFEKLDAFGESLAQTRADAIAGRKSSNIEEIWQEDEEFFEGIDDANRSSESRTNWRQKPPGQSSGLKEKQTRSTIFPNITKPFVNAAAARFADIVLPTDDANFKFKPTPVPDLVMVAEGDFDEIEGVDYSREDYAQQENQQVDFAKTRLSQAIKQANLAQKRVSDWHIECQYHAQVRKVIEDAARMGIGILKGPVPKSRTRIAWINGQVQQVSDVSPASEWIDPWNFYPDKDCGENINNGAYTWERRYITKRQLRVLRDAKVVLQDGSTEDEYITDQINRCLKEGPMKASDVYKQTPDPITDPTMKDKFEMWIFYSTAEKEDLEAAGENTDGIEDPHVPVMGILVNHHVIKLNPNPIDTGDYPYDVFLWGRRSGHWTGIGVAREIRVAQKIYTGAYRNLMDNAGIAAGPMIVFQQGKVVPADGIAGLAPRKVFYIQEDTTGLIDATKAIGQIKIDMMVDELLAVAHDALKIAEDTTGLPMLMQGQMGSAPDRVGVVKLLNNNASSILRRLGRIFDDRITEPHARRYYVWLLLYGEDAEKGDYTIDARGSTALIEQEIQSQEIWQMANIVLDPRFELSAPKWAQQMLKSRRYVAEDFTMDEDEKEAARAAAQPPPDPRVQVKQMEIQSKEALAAQEMDFDAQKTVGGWQHEKEQNNFDRELDMMLAESKGSLEGLALNDAAQEHLETTQFNLTKLVNEIKSRMRIEREKMAATERLVRMHATADRLPKAEVEPPGKASTGHSQQQ